jgi:hypothetical protein
LDFYFSLLRCSDDNDGCGFLTVAGWVLWQWVSHFLTAKEPGAVWFVMESDGFAVTMSLG